MKRILFLIAFLSLFVFTTKAQKVVKYQGAEIPLGPNWEVVTNMPDVYLKLKMEEDSRLYFYLAYLGENITDDEATKDSMRFFKALLLDMSKFQSSTPKRMIIGKKGKAMRFQWRGKNKKGKPCVFYAYLYKSAEKRGKTKFYAMVYEEQCWYEGYCEKYQMHREIIEKEFKVK